MGGVDIHDRLCLQRYSITRFVGFRKYYGASYIVCKDQCDAPFDALEVHEVASLTTYPAPRVVYDTFSPAKATVATLAGVKNVSPHVAEILDEWRNQDTQPKQRQRACNDCSMMKETHTTALHAMKTTHVYLCMRPRQIFRGVTMVCSDVGHNEWKEKLRPSDAEAAFLAKLTGLSNDFTYIMPGRKKKGGVRGRDYFVEEEELMKNLNQLDLGMWTNISGMHLRRKPAAAKSKPSTRPPKRGGGTEHRRASSSCKERNDVRKNTELDTAPVADKGG
ncbi:Hypothetical protein PHPALM_15128 [Phytophthora palmivora]|uniref:Uncharacterized protein n=1 Tax=Phytophthora palmivora TaxID=4796 RepID=A0A2P4XT05_9STRA|nr:Hypothetical protein PHPALM_15128 [Phytophthora palmivora]